MLHNERARDIDASAEEVWAVLSRFMHIDEFHPGVASVDALTDGEDGVGSKRRCHFKDNTSVVEEVVDWQPGRSYCVRLSDFSLPLKDAYADLTVESLGDGRSRAKMAMDYSVKFGPLGWLMGQTMMKAMTGKIFNGVLAALARKAESDSLVTPLSRAS